MFPVFLPLHDETMIDGSNGEGEGGGGSDGEAMRVGDQGTL
jgi:hypothetical protein